MLTRLEAILVETARARTTLTYGQLAKALDLQPPHTIHQATVLLEELMRLNAITGKPQLASFVVSRAGGGLPASRFFSLLQELGLYEGSIAGDDARAFHNAQKQLCYDADCFSDD